MEKRNALLAILAESKSLGFLGPGDPADHLSHAVGFAEVALARLSTPPAKFADLGSGGGIPGLVLAAQWSDATAALIESAVRRSAALREWITELGLEERVEVLEGRAEAWARLAPYRESFDLVTARSFARPAVTAEIAAGLVRVGGILVVSDPPEASPDRWPAGPLDDLGFEVAEVVEVGGAHYASLRKVRPARPDIPRPVGKPGKRPLW